MKLFLHIKVSCDRYSFSPPPFKLDVNVKYFDIDNFSDPVTINTMIEAMSRAKKLFLFIEAINNEPLGPISKVLNRLPKLDIPYSIVCNGSHMMLDKMISRFKKNLILNLEVPKIEEESRLFFSH